MVNKNNNSNKRIAITHDFLIDYGGAELVLKELLSMFPDADLITPVNWIEGPKDLLSVLDKHKIITSNTQNYPKIFRKFWKLLIPNFVIFFENHDFSKYDVVISLSSSFAKWIKVSKNSKHIAYINTPPRFLWGMDSTIYHKIPSLIKNLFSTTIKDWKKKDKNYAKSADILIANSKNIQQKIKEIYNLDSEVIYPPVRLTSDYDEYNVIAGDFYLIVNRLVSYKNIDKIIQAFKNSNRKLVIIGKGPEEQNLKNMAGENVHFTGFVDDETRNEYLASCKALIYPGFEDFGIGMVEALNFGKPVLAYNRGGAKEILTDGTGVYFDDYKIETIKDALDELDSKKFKSSTIIRRAKKFSAKKFRKKILELI